MTGSIIIIKSSSTNKQLKDAFKKIKSQKKFNAMKYLGTVKDAFGNPIDFQKKLRDEWA